MTKLLLVSVATTDVSITNMESPHQKIYPHQRKSGWFAKGGTFTSIMAVTSASCCILPIILVNVGLSSAVVGHLGIFTRLRPWFIVLSAALILAGFLYAFRSRQRPSKRTLFVLIVAALLTICALVLRYYEGDIQRWLNLTNR